MSKREKGNKTLDKQYTIEVTEVMDIGIIKNRF